MAATPLTISKTYQAILNSALEMKLASIKRAINTSKTQNPRFQEIYLLEQRETLEVQNWVKAAKTVE